MACLGCGKDKYIIGAMFQQKYSLPQTSYDSIDLKAFVKGTHLEDYSTKNDFSYSIQTHHYQPVYQTQYPSINYQSLTTPTNFNIDKLLDQTNIIEKKEKTKVIDPVKQSKKIPIKISSPKAIDYRVIQKHENKKLRDNLSSKINSARKKNKLELLL